MTDQDAAREALCLFLGVDDLTRRIGLSVADLERFFSFEARAATGIQKNLLEVPEGSELADIVCVATWFPERSEDPAELVGWEWGVHVRKAALMQASSYSRKTPCHTIPVRSLRSMKELRYRILGPE